MLLKYLTALVAVLFVCDAVPTPTNSKDGGPIGELPENWDQTKDDTQSLFLNKSDKNDLEPYPLALSEEGNSEGYEQGVDQRFDSPQSTGELDNLIMRPELYGEPPAMEGLSAGYESRRRKRGSGTKVGGAGAATKVATKSGSGKKNLKPEDRELSPVEAAGSDHDAHRRKRGSGTKVGGAAASAKTATKNSGGNKKNFRPLSERRKRDSGLSAADVRALLNLWEAQERRKQEYNNQWAADHYYNRVNGADEDQPEVDENGDIWYNEPVVIGPRERDYPHHSYFSEQNRMALARGYPDQIYQVDPSELAQRYEEARRKRNYANKMKRFMVARKRSDELSESTLDVHIPSYPGSPRSVNAAGSDESLASIERGTFLREAVDFLHRDNEFLVAAEIGNDRILDIVMSAGTDVQQMDHLGRNALHLAVCADNYRAILKLLRAGVNVNVKDNLGMTPLSLCLMRRPSMKVANLLFDYGATIMTRTDPTDTGLFIQFVMMCVPSEEEAKILHLLVEKGACVNDPDAPGGRQALHFAAMSNNCRLIHILTDLGADFYLTNHRGETPREVAKTFKCREAQELLEKLETEGSVITSFATITTIADAFKFE